MDSPQPLTDSLSATAAMPLNPPVTWRGAALGARLLIRSWMARMWRWLIRSWSHVTPIRRRMRV